MRTVNNLLKKKTTLLLTLCMIIGMTGLPITAYAEGLVSGAADKAAPEIGFSVTDSVYGATELKEEKLPMLFSPMSAVEWEGDGDADSPYQVSSAEHLADIPNQGLDKYYIQTANIYLTEAGYTDWTPLGTYAAPFTAKYDGDGYVIRGLTVTGSNNNASLLGFVSGGAVIENIHIRDANVTGGLNVGILVGIISDGGGATGGATIRNCSTGGMVSGTARVGGMIGAVQHDDAVIRESFSTADVAADPANSSQRGAAGGLAGFVLSGLVENCYASGQVTAGRYTGGFAGEMQGGTARYCYANVPVAGTNPGGFLGYKQGSPTITSCFFDSDSAGTTSSAAGTVKRATEMKQQGTFSDWDFTCIWSISEDAFYPVLRYYDSKWTPDERIAGDLSAISWGLIRDENTNQTAVIVDLNLPLSGGLGSTIAWSADIEGIINTETGAVTRPADHDQIVVLTATVSYAGGTSRSKTFTLIVISGAFAWEGSGSEADPYQVSSAAHLDDLRNLMGPGVHFIQTENIDLTGINWTPIGINTPDSAQFTGAYDGNNKTISNMTIDSDAIQYIGLFGYVGSGGTLENITLENISINSSRSSARVGGLTGQNRGGTIKDSCVSGSITATGESARTGGLIGDSYLGGTIENSRTSCTVTGGEGVINTIGGLVGRQQGGSIRNSYSTGNATGTYYVGGLVGYLLGSGTIEYCYSTGNVTVTGTPYSGDIGGLVGCANDGTITNCCSTGNVSGEPDLTVSYFAGGLVGSVYDVNITDSYSTGSVTLSCGDSDTNQGGFIGYVGSSSVTLENCYSTGNVTNLNLSDGSLGGFIGSKSNYTPTITSCYYLDTAAGASAGGEPLTDAELKQWESFVGWDFGGIWLVEEGHDTPVLSWQVDFAGGDGSADAPYQIETALQLNKVRGYLGDSNIHFEQKNDITLPNVAAGESNWAPIGTDLTPFTGTYDGGGYSISNLTINNSTIQCVGLFGSVGTGGTLENIRLTGVNISSITWGAYVGGVTGVNQGTVINSSSEGSVSGGDSANVGGLIGNGGGVITYNYSAANVTGGNNANVGGLLGRSYVSTSDNYSTGTITGGDNARVGGLIGDVDDGTVTNSYSTGSASGGTGASSGGLIGGGNATVNDSYYLDTAGTSAGGAPLTAAQMKQWESFEGWNFDSVWKIGQNISYPTLQWQTWTADEEITADLIALIWDDIRGMNDSASEVTTDLALPGTGARGTAIAWSAAPTGYINTSDGTLTKPYTDEVIVTLTASVSKSGGTTQTKSFSLTVKPLTPDEAIALDKAALTWDIIKGTNIAEDYVTADLELPDTGASGTTAITWSAAPEGYIDISDGKVTLPDDGNKTVTLTAAITRDGKQQEKTFDLTIIAHYPVTFTAGTGGSITVGTSGSYEAGTVIDISAAPDSGYQFDKWITGSGGSFGNTASASTTFTVPANAVTVTATFTRRGSGDRDDREGSGNSGGKDTPPKPAEPEYKAEVKAGDGEEEVLIVTVDKNSETASVDADLQSLDKGGSVITIPTVPDVDAYSVSLPVTSLSTADAQGTLTVNTDKGSITIPSNMLTGIPGISGSKAQISIAQGDKNALSDAVKAAVGDRPLIRLTVSIDGKQTEWSNPSIPVTVSIPYTPTAAELANHESIVVWYIDGSGNAVSVPNGRYDPATGTVTFNTTHFSHYAIVYVHKTFSDLGSAEWARKPVEVMASKGIINGTGKDTFSPAASITRADYLVLLVKTLELAAEFDSNFDDIDKSTYYYDAIGIAKKLDIAAGSGNNRFNPRESISRQDMMVMTARALERFKGLKVSDTNGELDKFADKEDIAEYAVNSMSALITEGLIAGTGNKLNPCAYATRAEAAVFLYNIYRKYP